MRSNLGVFALSTLLLAPGHLSAAAGYLMYPLIADQPGVATLTDPNLVNPWGISISATSPFWVCDGGTGLSTVYTFSAPAFSISSTKAAIPPAPSGGDKTCTGIVSNGSAGFLIGTATPTKASFIFATLGGIDGCLGGGRQRDASAAGHRQFGFGRGLQRAGVIIHRARLPPPVARLCCPNFSSGAIEVYDTTWKPVTLAAGAFTDAKIPAGYAPFNIQYLGGTTTLEGKLYVTYAKQIPPRSSRWRARATVMWMCTTPTASCCKA